MALFNKKTKLKLSKSDWENEAANFPRFIVIKFLAKVCLVKFSPFLIEKVLSTRVTPRNVKKTRKQNLFVEVDSRRQAGNILKMKFPLYQMQSIFTQKTEYIQRNYQK